jgi:thiol-disulfide isomerase/thioredoxin
MRRQLLRHIAAAVCCASFAVAQAAEPGGAAPDFELSGTGGKVKLSALRGNVVYVDFWASWCGPCRQSFPWMNEMQARYGGQGLRIVGINVDTHEKDARDFLTETPATFTVAFDSTGATPRSYRIKGMPTSLLIDADGKVVFEHSGFRVADKAELEQRIQAALKGKSR